MRQTQPWKGSLPSKVLIIGHDPRLQKSTTEAEYCFFADYYFKKNLKKQSEKSKFGLARGLFNYISDLTSNKYNIHEFIITNLCNVFLPPVPKGKTILIPEDYARQGLWQIRDILKNSQIELIFAMSLQVNYWLQKLGFYFSNENFIKRAEPKSDGLVQYYNPSDSSVFQIICGKRFLADGTYPLYPILHVKTWPLKGNFKKAYQDSYMKIISNFD